MHCNAGGYFSAAAAAAVFRESRIKSTLMPAENKNTKEAFAKWTKDERCSEGEKDGVMPNLWT